MNADATDIQELGRDFKLKAYGLVFVGCLALLGAGYCLPASNWLYNWNVKSCTTNPDLCGPMMTSSTLYEFSAYGLMAVLYGLAFMVIRTASKYYAYGRKLCGQSNLEEQIDEALRNTDTRQIFFWLMAGMTGLALVFVLISR